MILADGMPLQTLGDVKNKNAERFKRLWRSVWFDHLFAWDRRQLAGHWKKTGKHAPGTTLIRGAEHYLEWFGVFVRKRFRRKETDGGFNVAICMEDCRRFAFDSDYLAILADDAAKAVIGHELGHAVSILRGLGSDEDAAEMAAANWHFPDCRENDPDFCRAVDKLTRQRHDEIRQLKADGKFPARPLIRTFLGTFRVKTENATWKEIADERD